ncbi:hypothetical protein [Edaphobacter bradus]|uniref:hypothetical protein n=1 Tax=Edaphobacter bradus TaxID=2259016 RepID=UPI0021E047CA|nr:hypothetical protein [Edaphobacter bradus]
MSSLLSARSTSRFLLGLLLLLTPNLHAADTIASSLKTDLLGKQLFLRNFSADKEQKFIWKDDHLEETTTVSVHALIAFVPHKITGDDTAVTMHGKCFIAVLDSETQKIVLSAYPQETIVKITFQQAPTAETAQNVEDPLFFPDAAAAAKAVPPVWRGLVPLGAETLHTQTGLLVETTNGWKRVAGDDPNLHRPTALDHDGNPIEKPSDPIPPNGFAKLTDFHRGALAALIDVSGRVRDIWILSPTQNMDTTARFVESIQNTRFQPAQWQNQSVRCILPSITSVRAFTDRYANSKSLYN